MSDYGIFPLICRYKNVIILALAPLVFCPLPILSNTMASHTAYIILVMATFWITEVTSLAVTSLLPLILLPLFGIVKASVVCLEYMRDTNVLLLGGLLIAVAIEEWNVHKRVALKILLFVGAQPRRLMLGFMIVTAFISMWITNTATTAMMTPIMEAVLKELDKYNSTESVNLESSKDFYNHAVIPNNELKSAEPYENHEIETGNEMTQSQITIREASTSKIFEVDNIKKRKHKQLCKAMMLCICYAANIGGIGTLTGSAPQLVLKGQMEQIFPKAPAISFIYWFVHAFPLMLVFLVISWIYLQAVFIGIRWKHLSCFYRGCKESSIKGKELYLVMKQQYDALGPVSFAEIEVMLSFLLLVVLWFFREPSIFPGWGSFFKFQYVTDGTPAVLVGFLLFQLPSKAPNKPKRLLSWPRVQKVFPWDVLFLLGAGFALAKACEDSKLSLWLSCQLVGLKVLSPFLIVLIISAMVTFLTEITSNTATAAILLPVLASLAQSVHVHPLYLMLPTTICVSFAFMLPVATPPNAIVFGTGRIMVKDMALAGFGMNILGILLITLSINTWGYSYYDLKNYPTWANSIKSNSSVRCV
ncbi:Na(+)/citrate cotransporter isoform X2 [Hydra vulgaris]|uniref:Na(+)/citrate cotransporter isoform X2 n=1 Tax=Hydra vulgaris TaxID=6087 RepID=UPI001F5F05E7|nr:solute carrier family 13 member 5 isoform X3 [Hydra vulgaris]